MRELGKKVFETFKVSPKRFIRFFLVLHYILPNDGGSVDRAKFLQEDLEES